MKKIKNKTKKKIIDYLLNTQAILIFVFVFYLWWLESTGFLDIPGNEIYDEVGCTIFIVESFLWLFFYFKFGDGNMYPTDRFKFFDKYKLNYESFTELNEDVRKKLKLKKYSFGKEYIISTKEEKVYIYYKKESNNISLWIMADLISFTKDKWKKIGDCFKDFYDLTFGEENYELEKGLVVLCVKRYSTTFEEFVKETIEMFGTNMSVGINMNEKIAYVPDFNNDLTDEFFCVVDATLITKKRKK